MGGQKDLCAQEPHRVLVGTCACGCLIMSQPVVVLRRYHLLCLPLLKVVSVLHLFLSVYQIFTKDGVMPASSYLYNCILDASAVLVSS